MSEQVGYPYQRYQRANPTRAGHFVGTHPEDAPYTTGEKDVDDQYYPTRAPTSAIRYTTTEGNRVIQRGRQRIVIHDEPPPRRRQNHISLYIGIGMVAMVLCFVGLYVLSNWWTDHQLDATYGMPRTWQTDQVVGIGDSPAHPSHFIFINLQGRVLILFFPGGDASHAKIYIDPQIFTDDAASIPVTGEFRNVGNGHIDMIVHIGDQQIIYLNDGTQFKPQ